MITSFLIEIRISNLFKYLLLAIITCSTGGAQVKLFTDFADETVEKLPIHDIWSVTNRISPTEGSNVRQGLKMNIVRMIGGIKKEVNGTPQKDLDFDPCLYDSINNVYVYRWEPLINRLDKLIASHTEIFQIALDQPPWAFQHGYTFIKDGTRDGIHFRESEKMSKYGNSLPPYDKEAYHDFVKALMTKLVEVYGEEQVLLWRFRVGSEIETPEHWYGSKQDFIEHYANTVSAVRAVLPNATLGLHTREPGFFKEGKKLNYKGEHFASFIDDLIAYNHANNIKCDFWGISDYITIGNHEARDMNIKYAKVFAPLIDNPKWNKNTTIDVMEYSTVTTMQGADGRGLIPCETSHSDIIELAYANIFFKNKDKGLNLIYRWGNRPGSNETEAIKMLKGMLGKMHYVTSLSGQPKTATNQIDAIFGKDKTNKSYDIIIYNYNSDSLNYLSPEKVSVSFNTDLPVGTTLYFRSKTYSKDHNMLQNFIKTYPNFVKEGFDDKGAPHRILTRQGYKVYKNYKNPYSTRFTQWKPISTEQRQDGKPGSMVLVNTELESFAFEKFEFRLSAH